MALLQFDTQAAAPERGYHKLKCEGIFEWIGGKLVQHPCGRIVWAPRQASMCNTCAKAKRAAHMREVRAKAKRPTDFGQCLVWASGSPTQTKLPDLATILSFIGNRAVWPDVPGTLRCTLALHAMRHATPRSDEFTGRTVP